MSDRPLVSILCATYNQKDYIAQTIEGFLIQKVDFPIEIIIHDDASTDGTADIVRKYESEHPELIKGIYQTENQYSKKVPIWETFIYPLARGTFIAECEGDDYWTDPNKIQKQADFLRKNPDYGLCYGIARQYIQARQAFSTNRGKDYISFEHLLKHSNCIPTLTACARKSLVDQYNQERKSFNQTWKMGDYPQWLWFAAHTKIKFFPEVFGVYRILKVSAAHFDDVEKQVEFYKSGYNCANFFSERYLNKPLPPFDEHRERARLYSTKIHDRKKAYEEYRKIPQRNWKYRILTFLHSNPVSFLLLRIYYSTNYKQ